MTKRLSRNALANQRAGVFSIGMAKGLYAERGAGPVVYVVDDEPMLLDLAEMVLIPVGFQVQTFQDPRRALADYAAADPPPDVVITDYAMGVMNGLELIYECRRLHPDQKTILLSGTVDEGIYAHAPAKPDRFLAKPYKTDQFIAAVRALTGY